jgi:hypothetical protein
LKFFYTHVLAKPWVDIPMIKPPRCTRIPDIVTSFLRDSGFVQQKIPVDRWQRSFFSEVILYQSSVCLHRSSYICQRPLNLALHFKIYWSVAQPTTFKSFYCSRAGLTMPLTFDVSYTNKLVPCKQNVKAYLNCFIAYNTKPFQAVKCLILLALLPHTQPFQPMIKGESARKGNRISYHKQLRGEKQPPPILKV